MNPVIFDPSVEKLQAVVASTSLITHESGIEVVHATRLRLRDARVAIEKQGKTLRADALKFQKDVIAREKELLGIIAPEEERLAEIEEREKVLQARLARAALLPMRKEQVEKFGKVVPDGFIIDMDNDEFAAYLNQLHSEKNEADRLAIEAERAKLAREAELQAAREQERARIEALTKESEERRIQKAAQDKYDADLAAKKVIDEALAEAARIKKESEDEADRISLQKAKEEAERIYREQEERKQRESQALYKQWLTKIGYKDIEAAEWHFITTGGTTEAYKLVGSFKQVR